MPSRNQIDATLFQQGLRHKQGTCHEDVCIRDGWGVGAGFVLAFVAESLLLGIGWVILGGRRKAVKESWR